MKDYVDYLTSKKVYSLIKAESKSDRVDLSLNLNSSLEWQSIDEDRIIFYRNLLNHPENYKKSSESDLKFAVKYYIDFVERRKFQSYKTETFYQYMALTG